MSIINEEDILKILISYNEWWRTWRVPKDATKEMKRTAFYEANKAFTNKEIRRFVILTGARRVGKTTILYQQIQDLIDKGILVPGDDGTITNPIDNSNMNCYTITVKYIRAGQDNEVTNLNPYEPSVSTYEASVSSNTPC